jgi:hypothetical protein
VVSPHASLQPSKLLAPVSFLLLDALSPTRATVERCARCLCWVYYHFQCLFVTDNQSICQPDGLSDKPYPYHTSTCN